MKEIRKLNVFDIFSIATGAMISSGIFILPGIAYAKTGPSVVLSYILASFFALPGVFSMAELITAMPKTGSETYILLKGLGPDVGFVAGLIACFSLITKAAFSLLGMSIFIENIIHLPIVVIASLLCIVLLFFNLIGIKKATLIQNFLVIFLILIMFFYPVFSLREINISHFTPFFRKNFLAVFSTAGFVFISYAGLLKISTVAGETKKPGKYLPIGIISSYFVILIIYAICVFSTIGILGEEKLSKSLTPLSDGAYEIMGFLGRVVMNAAALLAFVSTANVGMMSAARTLIPLSEFHLLPSFIARTSKRFMTPYFSLIIVSLIIIAFLFLKIEILVEVASIFLVIQHIFINLAVIVFRESKIQSYKPTFNSPLYPYIQIMGVVCLIFILAEMEPLPIALALIILILFFLLALLVKSEKKNVEYALLKIVENITKKDSVCDAIEKELSEIVFERDEIVKDRFDEIIENCKIIDLEEKKDIEGIMKIIADEFSKELKMDKEKIFDEFINREKTGSTVINNFLAIPHIIVDGNNILKMLIIRAKNGIEFSKEYKNINVIFAIVASPDERNFYLKTLAAIAQICHSYNFDKKWLCAKNTESLRHLILHSARRRF